MKELPLRGESKKTKLGVLHYVKPAALSSRAVDALLKLFTKKSHTFLKALLVDHKNKPMRANAESVQNAINVQLRTMRIGNKRYYLACRNLHYQLWELA